MNLGTGGTEQIQQTTRFADEMEGVSVYDEANVSEIDTSDGVSSADIGKYFMRPVRIASFTYTEGAAPGEIQSILPWTSFFNQANVKFKLHNYAFVRCDLKIKVIINASPFYYGAVRVSYCPLHTFSDENVVANSLLELIPYSQQPGFFIYPQGNVGGEMTLPFLWKANYLHTVNTDDFDAMGRLKFHAYTPLRSANGVTGTGVTIQVYAWAENLELAGPTVALALQAQDEYGDGPVSGPASTVARIAGMVKGVPIIGKFATATEMGARAVSGIAKLFGFTNVPVIEPAAPMRSLPFPPLASAEIGYPVEKLTLDSKNELTIDGSAVGFTSEDELAIERIVTHQSYLTATTWTTTSPVDTPLFTTAVRPELYDRRSTPQVQLTPLALMAQLFDQWRGDIIFTFKIIASPFHKGRLRISYDPASAAVQTTGDTGPTVFNTIVDISEQSEIEFRVPYQQAEAWQELDTNIASTPAAIWTTSTTPAVTLAGNGILSLKVLTLLTAPVSTAPVTIQVFVRGADNMEFAYPCPQGPLSYFALQAMEEVIGEQSNPGMQIVTMHPNRNRVYMGEVVRSLRPLLRRANLVDRLSNTSTATNSEVAYTLPQQPLYFGYDPNGAHLARNQAGTANVPFNWVFVTPYQLLTPCFAARRGSYNWYYNLTGPEPSSKVLVGKRNNNNTTSIGSSVTTVDGTLASRNRSWYNAASFTQAGAAITNQITQAGLSVSTGNYTPFKFQSTRPNTNAVPTSGAPFDGSAQEGLRLVHTVSSGVVNSYSIERYFGVGTDFNLHFFRHIPTMYVVPSVGAPV